MKAMVYEAFRTRPQIVTVDDPTPADGGVVIRVAATGLCRSDWHGWMGHDSGIQIPHVPGHEFAGQIESVGKSVRNWKVGERVTMPFVAGCGICPECSSGNQQVCPDQFQPGFTHWGSFAEYVAVDFADTNLVALPDSIDFATAASLGCRFATSFRALAAQGRVAGGEWVAVHGCGGVGLSAVMIAQALGGGVVAIDIADNKLEFAKTIGARETVNASTCDDVVEAVKAVTDGGAHVSIDALGSPETCFHSIACLRPRGRHVQVGLMLGEDEHPKIPMDQLIAMELQVLGSHGMQAHADPDMLSMIDQGLLEPDKLVGSRITLEAAIEALTNMDSLTDVGITIIDRL